jgi:hypothetical protein
MSEDHEITIWDSERKSLYEMIDRRDATIAILTAERDEALATKKTLLDDRDDIAMDNRELRAQLAAAVPLPAWPIEP